MEGHYELRFRVRSTLFAHTGGEQGHPDTPVEHRHTDGFLKYGRAGWRPVGSADERAEAGALRARRRASAGHAEHLPHRLLEMPLQPPLSSPAAASVAERSFMAAGCTVDLAQLEGDEEMSCCVVAPAKPTAAASRATYLPVQQGASGGEMRVSDSH